MSTMKKLIFFLFHGERMPFGGAGISIFLSLSFFLGVREPGAFCTELRVQFLRDYLCNQIFGFMSAFKPSRAGLAFLDA